jgi:ABC-type branched-subunit amino acid transport system substrate-binding protein
MNRPVVGIILSAVALVAVVLFAGGAAAATGASGQGVTSSTIKIGITYPNISDVKSIDNVDPGNYVVAFTALINQINARGGINGRKLSPVFASVDPIGTAGAATACSELTQDDKVFVVLGFFQAADTACYVDTRDVPIIGASLDTAAAAQAKAPWFNDAISDSELVPKEMRAFKLEGHFAGKKVGVVGTSADRAEMSEVLPELHKLKVNVVQTAVNSVPDSDAAAQTQQYGVIADKFQSSGVNLVVAVGTAGGEWAGSLQDNQSTYLPRLIVTDYLNLEAYVDSSGGDQPAIVKDAMTAGSTPPVSVEWNDPAMKRCVAAIQTAEPTAKINNPVTATPATPVTWNAPELACQQMALLTDFLKAAGRTLTNKTLARGGASLTDVTIPGGGGTFNFADGHHDGDGPVFIYEWSPATKGLALKASVG